MKQIENIIGQFATEGEILAVKPIENGHINDTYQVKTVGDDPDYILQRINHQIFQDVDLLQENIRIITDHIRQKLAQSGTDDLDRRVIRLTPTKGGDLYYFDGKSYWRMMLFVKDSVTHERLDERLAELTGTAFGEFQEFLSDLPEGTLKETIPNFHNMEFRLEGFREAVAADSHGRLPEVQPLVDEILKRADSMCKAQELYRQGLLPKRVTHCDTKVNNILFDEQDRPLCVIDLDTTMPGFVLSDFGDFIRTGANTGAEDDENLANVSVNMDIFRAFTKGYLQTAGKFLSEIEKENLPFGAKMLTYMQTVRFLGDYLNGDTYYKIKHPKHNLQRSYAQFKLLQSIEENEADMQEFIRTITG